MDTSKNNEKGKTVKAGGMLNEHAQITEVEQEYREWFDVKPKGGMTLTSERGEGTAALADVQSDDVLELVLDDDIYLFTRRDDLEQDFPTDISRGAAPEDLVISSLRFGPPSRGVIDWAVKLLNVFHVDIAEKTGLTICKKFEEKSVPVPGLYKIEPAESLKLTPAVFGNDHDTTKPVLVFIHGTASSTIGSFGGIWEKSNAGIRKALFEHYDNRIYALEHWTLSLSPIQNAIELATHLPQNATVHLVSHSRGGIVGELACRSMVNDANEPFLPIELEAYHQRASAIIDELDEGKDEARMAYEAQIERLKELNALLKHQNIKFEKFVRVACPARGTTLASGRLDRWLSIIFNLVSLIPVLLFSQMPPKLPMVLEAVPWINTRTGLVVS